MSRSPSRARARIGCKHVVPERFDVLPEFCETLATGAIVVACALALLGDEPRVTQDPQMLGDGGLSDVRLTGEFDSAVAIVTQILESVRVPVYDDSTKSRKPPMAIRQSSGSI